MTIQSALKLFFTGLMLLFILQLLSYINWLLVDQQVIMGYLDKYILLKSPLIVIPFIFFLPLIIKIFQYYFD
ncbi:hypothetical protein [Listeria sp. PSOL-1]|uniref:hypothetical protein n=1 Tax=Listeria sp. PSOL-1 TaxID=1844999 RepID=UPI0013D60E41|nr:hypothetical protein [Listeria sp. PSOL-1]